MILQHATSASDVRTLLNRSMLQMNTAEVQGWMHHCYDDKNMFCWMQDHRIVSVLQLEHTALRFQGQDIAVNQIILGATHPDHRQRNYFSQLLDAALEQARYNELLSLVHTDFPKLFVSHGFVPISHTVSYWVNLQDFTLGNAQNVMSYRESMDLYPLYVAFVHSFDGSKVYTKEQFMKRIHYAQSIRKKIIVMMDQNGQPRGFAIYANDEARATVDHLVYLNSHAILDALAYIAKRTHSAAITISENERLEKITHLDYPREKGTTLMRINDPKLFSRWLHRSIKNAAQAYELLERPDWNHF